METSKCQVCGSPVLKGTKAAICPACETPSHPECWAYNGGCTTYACKESPAIKNSRAKPRVVVHDDRRGVPHYDRRAAHGQAPPPSFAGRVVESVTRAIGMCFALFVGFAFLAGFIEAVSAPGRRHQRYDERPPTRLQRLRFGDTVTQLLEVRALSKAHHADWDELNQVGSMAIWNPDTAIRQAAAQALVDVGGNDMTRQEYLCDLMGSKDPVQRKIARENIPRLGRPSPHALETLTHLLQYDPEIADEAMDLLEHLKPPPADLAGAAAKVGVPDLYREQMAKLTGGRQLDAPKRAH